MSWQRVSDADAARIQSGGSWVYREGKLRQVSIDGVAAVVQALMPEMLAGLAHELGVADFDDLEVRVADDLTSVTVTMHADGAKASTTRTLPLAELQ